LDNHDRNILELRSDKKLVFGVMMGQISEASKSTIRETPAGLAAIESSDPLLLLRAIILTHLSDPKLGAA
jgi:hypothetical protein